MNIIVLNKSTKYIFFFSFFFLFLILDVSAKTMVEDADLCGIKEIYRDPDTIEKAIGKNEYLDSTIGNKDYCPVYCVEDDTFTFPGFIPTVNSGAHFTWTIGENIEKNILSGYTINLKGRRNCQTKIDLKKWIKDYNDIQEKIITEVETLKEPLQEGQICPPNLGSRGCGIRLEKDFGETDAGAPTTFVNAGGLDNYISSTPNGGSKLYISEYFGTLDSNKYMNLYEFVPDTLWDAKKGDIDVDAGVAIDGYSYWFENQKRYKNLCPCEWRNEDIASASEVPVAISKGGIAKTTFNTTFNTDIDASFALKADGYKGEFTTKPSDTENVSISKSDLFCSNRYGVGSSSCDTDFWGIHESQTPEQAVQTTVNGSCSATITKKIKSEERTRKVPDGTKILKIWDRDLEAYVDVEVQKTKDEIYTVFVVESAKVSNIKCEISSIKQEKCQGDSNMKDYIKECVDAGPTCPDGYHIGSDGQCNKTNTSYLRTLIEKQKLLIDILEKCSDWDINYYNLDTEAYVNYEEPTYDRIELLSRNLTEEDHKENHKIYGKDDINLEDYVRYFSNSGASVSYWVCDLGASDRECKQVTKNVSLYWISEYGKEYSKEYDFFLPKDFYRYVLLPKGLSVDKVPPDSEYEKRGLFIDIGYANYPVHFNTQTREPKYNLDIYFDKVGYLNKFSNDVYNNNYSESTNKTVHIENFDGKKLVYDCEYIVNEGSPYCPSDGCKKDEYDLGTVRLIYRPISLENPFPAMSGNGRNTGSNWCTINSTDGTKNCKNNATNETVNDYILNNRNTEGSNVYNKEPMYEITLTPAVINRIRDYNEDTNYDDYNLSCSVIKGKEGTECRSYFVSPDAAKDLEETGLDTMGGAITGCGVDADFYDCDNLDGYER